MKRAALLIHGPLSVKGGVERFNRYLLEFLSEEGFQVDLFEPSKIEVPKWIRRFLYPLVQYYYAGREVKKHLSDYDLIMTTGYTGGFLRGPKVMNITFGSVQSYFQNLQDPRASWKIRFGNQLTIFFDALSKKGKTCVAISPQVGEELKKDYGVESVMVPCGLDIRHFSKNFSGSDLRRRLGIAPDAFVGLYAGRWAEFHKGLDVFIPLMKERKDVTWILLPDCPLDLKEIPNAKVIENVSYEELPSFYSAADFGVQLSRYESFGFFLAESLSCSLPVITTPVGIVPQMFRGSMLEELIVSYGPAGDSKLLIEGVHRLIDLLKDQSYRQKLSDAGRKKVVAGFSLEIWKAGMKKAVEKFLKENSCVSSQ